jgi:hypothetical protein
MADATLKGALADSLEALEREVPAAYRAMCRAFASSELLLHIDGASIALAFTVEAHQLPDSSRHPCIEIRASEATLLAILDGELQLLTALLSERLVVLASLEDLLRCEEGFLNYLRGAVRSPSFPRILERRRAAIATLATLNRGTR